MKKFALLIAIIFMFSFTGIVNALIFTDAQILNVTIGEGPIAQTVWGNSYSYTHATPNDFEVPWDTVNSALLDISGYWVNGNNDQVEILGSIIGTLTPGESYGGFWIWSWDTPSVSTFDISSIFSLWSAEDPFSITITANGSFPDGIIQLDTSTFTLDYKNNVAPVPEPATILLLSSGLAAFAGFGRRKIKSH